MADTPVEMDVDDSTPVGVNLIAYIRAEMGLGTAARGIALALESANVPFNIINFEYQNPSLHRDTSWKHKEADYSSHDFTILAVNPDNIFNARDRAQKEFVKQRYTIGYWFWELPEIPDDWLSAFSLVDEVWAASRFVQDSISLKSPVPVFRVPVAVRLGPTDKFSRWTFSFPERQFLFLSMSDTHSQLARKNPLGVVRAFKKVFSGDDKSVGLILKINNFNSINADREAIALLREEIRGYLNIYLLDSVMTRAEIDALLAISDCFISLHRSEGFGLGPAEAMSLGKPVILTNWSGNTDYMTPDNSIGVDYQLIPVGKQSGPYEPDQLWADPDLEQAAFWMKHLAQDPEFANRIGLLGQETIRNEFSPEVVGKLVHKRLYYLRRTALSGRTIEGGSTIPED
jgi:glycosyltransferase involved in cell wall biosynthesis